MPVQWPIFINNLSKKLASKTSKGPDDIGMFVANEYFNAVKTAQTVYGNIHKSGEKSILEIGFKKAFNMLFDSASPILEDKFGNPIYDDLFEKLPGIDMKYNVDCEFESWVEENKATIIPFEFYPMFPTTCPNPKVASINVNLFADIYINSENLKDQPESKYVTLSIEDSDGTPPYEFVYSLNGNIQPSVESDSNGIALFLAPTDPGIYDYIFISAIDSTKKVELKDINRSASIEIKQNINILEIKVDNSIPFQLVPIMSDSRLIIEISKRVLYQNNGTKDYINWVKRFDNNLATFEGKVKKQTLDWIGAGLGKLKVPTLVGIEHDNIIRNRLFQEESIDRHDTIIKLIDSIFICKYTYIKDIDGKIGSASLKNETKRIKDKVLRYNKEKELYRLLKIRYVNEVAAASIKIGIECDTEDPYCVMSKCIIDYWKSTTSKPFAASPPILPCLIPSPGMYVPIYYGDEGELGSDLRRALNTGKQFKHEPNIQTASRLVATAFAVSCAKHLKDLKFIYNGKIPIGTSTAPMIGISPFAF